MNEQGDKQEATQPQTTAPPQAPTADSLSKLMSTGTAGGTDLERRALAAAEAAIADSQRALDQARAQLRQQPGQAAAKGRNGRELLLRVLLGINVVAMVVVALLPTPTRSTAVADPAGTPGEHGAEVPEHDPVVKSPRIDDPVLRAFAAAEVRDYRGAIALLERHLADSPRLDPAKKANVLLALEHYATQIGDIPAAQEYQRKTEALRSSHSLPEDLIQMAQEAEKNGDVESMRRTYARLLLQQRQIPSALYRHVAEAYLKLGDSYRQEAQQADTAARAEELRALHERLRLQASESEGGTGK